MSIYKVREVFLDVLEGRMTRETADRWAHSVVQASESGNLSFNPSEKREQIWNGVMFLYGIDVPVGSGGYLYDDDDIRTAMKAKLGD